MKTVFRPLRRRFLVAVFSQRNGDTGSDKGGVFLARDQQLWDWEDQGSSFPANPPNLPPLASRRLPEPRC